MDEKWTFGWALVSWLMAYVLMMSMFQKTTAAASAPSSSSATLVGDPNLDNTQVLYSSFPFFPENLNLIVFTLSSRAYSFFSS